MAKLTAAQAREAADLAQAYEALVEVRDAAKDHLEIEDSRLEIAVAEDVGPHGCSSAAYAYLPLHLSAAIINVALDQVAWRLTALGVELPAAPSPTLAATDGEG